MEVTDILGQIEFNTGVFPRKAVEQAIVMKEQITPALLGILEEAQRNIHKLIEQEDYMSHIYAMFLLAQFREKRAYPLIVDLFSIPGDTIVDLTGDVVTEDLGRILASVCAGDVTLIEHLIENPAVNDYVRGSAMQALLVLVVDGVLTRKKVMTYYQTLFHGKLTRVPSELWGLLLNCITDLYPAEVLEDIEQVFKEGLVDGMLIDFKDVTKQLALGQEKTLQQLQQDMHNQMMGNVVEEMQWWACFRPPSPLPQPQPPKVEKMAGRNDPCPCGSGKKYKKCCGATL